MANIEFSGDIKEFENFLNFARFNANLRNSLQKATLRICLFLVAAVRINIKQKGDFTKNAPLTLALKKSNRPLIDTLQVVRAIEYKVQDAFTAEIGVFANRLSQGSKGKGHVTKVEMQKLVELTETGFTIKVTPKMRAALMAALTKEDTLGGKAPKNNKVKTQLSGMKGTAVYRVPPRKIFTKVWDDPVVEKEIQQMWRLSIEEAFKNQGAKDGEHRDR